MSTVCVSAAPMNDKCLIQTQARNFTMRMDEPVAAGGDDSAMTPVEALLSALGGCLCLMGEYESKRLGIDLQSLRVEIEGDMNFRDEYKGFKEIRLCFYLKTSATQEEAETLVAAIEHDCPVSSTLRGSAHVLIDHVIIE